MTAAEVLGKIKQARKVLAQDPNDSPRTRVGIIGAQRKATDSMDGLVAAYAKALQAKSVTIVLLGEPAHLDAFMVLAKKENVNVSVDIREFYKDIATKIWPSVAKQEWTANQLNQTIQTVLTIGTSLGVIDIDYDYRKGFIPKHVVNLQHATELVRETIRERIGDTITRGFIYKTLVDRALASDTTDASPVPVLIVGAEDEAEANSLQQAWPSKTAVVRIDQEPTPESVVATFHEVLKGSKPAPKKTTKPISKQKNNDQNGDTEQ